MQESELAAAPSTRERVSRPIRPATSSSDLIIAAACLLDENIKLYLIIFRLKARSC